MNTESYWIKFTGKANIPSPLQLDSAYTVTISGEVPSSTDVSNQNGTKDTIFKFVPITAQIVDDKGAITKVRDMRKMSEKLRAVVKFLWEQDSTRGEDREDAYERFVRYCITHAQEIYDASKKR